LTDPLPADLAARLAESKPRFGRLGTSVHYFSSTESTNDVGVTLAVHGHEGAVVIADAQTAGRGRRGRTWYSPPLTGLYVSVVLKPWAPLAPSSPGSSSSDNTARARALVTLAAGVALSEGLESACGLGADIKWPNDLIVDGRKLAGILAEAVGEDGVVLGYGINVASSAYPPELAGRVTSIERELGRPVEREGILVETLAALARRYDDLLAQRFDAILDDWRRRSPGSIGKRVQWNTPGGIRSGVTAGVDDLGALLVANGDRVERLVAGEVVWS
jgi:BirA family biotin operon repressor/biotin-[acetyl-CoA-carboxylase] ligase